MSTTTEARNVLVAVLVLGAACRCTGDQRCGGRSPTAGSLAYGFGPPASEAELARFDSSLPDGRELPAGSGTVAQGKGSTSAVRRLPRRRTCRAASATG